MIFLRYKIFDWYSNRILKKTDPDINARHTSKKILGIPGVKRYEDLVDRLEQELKKEVYDKPYKINEKVGKEHYEVLTAGSTGQPKLILKNEADSRRTMNLLVNVLRIDMNNKEIREFFNTFRKVNDLYGEIIILSGLPYLPIYDPVTKKKQPTSPSYVIQRDLELAYEKLLGINIRIIFIKNFEKKYLDNLLEKYKDKNIIITGAWHIVRPIIIKTLEYNVIPFMIGTGGEPVPKRDLEKILTEVEPKLSKKGLNFYLEYVYASSEFYLGDTIQKVENVIEEAKKYKSETPIIKIPLSYTIILGIPAEVKGMNLLDMRRNEIKEKILKDPEILENKLLRYNDENIIGKRILAIFTPLYSKIDGVPRTVYKNYIGLWDTFRVVDLDEILNRPVLYISDIKRAGGFIKVGNALVDLYKLAYDLEEELNTMVRLQVEGKHGIYDKLIIRVLDQGRYTKPELENRIDEVLRKYIALWDELGKGIVKKEIEIVRALPNNEWVKSVRKREKLMASSI